MNQQPQSGIAKFNKSIMEEIGGMNKLVKNSLVSCALITLAALAGLVFSSYQLTAIADASSDGLDGSSALTIQPETTDLGNDGATDDGATAQESIDDARLYFGNYTYQANAGDNLTYLARKSIQIHLDNEPQTGFEASQVVAAETHIVQSMGAFELAIGQEVAIDVVLVASQIETASKLDQNTLACWARYLPIRENLDFIQPTSLPQVIVPADSSEGATSQDEAEVAGSNEQTQGGEGGDAKDQSPLFLAIIGTLALVIIAGWILIAIYRQKEEGGETGLEQDPRKPLSKLAQSQGKLASKARALPKSIGEQKDKLSQRRAAGKDAPKRRRGRPRKER